MGAVMVSIVPGELGTRADSRLEFGTATIGRQPSVSTSSS